MTIRSFATMGSLTLLAAVSMYGQQLKLDIPFEFQIGEKVLPAGHYEVRRAYDNTPDRLTFTCWENKTHQTFFFPRRLETKPGDPGSVLVFNRYGDKYFLAKVVATGYIGGLGLIQSESEREVARNTPSSETGQVVLARR